VAEQLDVRAAVKFFGGPADLARRAGNAGTPLRVKTIEKWQERGQLPGIWIMRLAQLAKKEGRKFEIYDFIKHKEATK
jgi:hypothetical protein